MVLDPIPQPLSVHFLGSRPQPPTSPYCTGLYITYVYVCIYVYISVHFYIFTYTYIYVYAHTHTQIIYCRALCGWMCSVWWITKELCILHSYVCTYTYIYPYMFIHLHTHTNICTHTRTHAHTHTQIIHCYTVELCVFECARCDELL